MMHRTSTPRLKLMWSRYNGQIFEINVPAKFLVSLTDRLPGLFSCLSRRKLTTEKESSQVKSLVNAEDCLMELDTILTVPCCTFGSLKVASQRIKRVGSRQRARVSNCWRVVRTKKQYRSSNKVWLFSEN